MKRLHRKEPAVRGVARVLANKIDSALRVLTRTAFTDGAVHDLRKRLKEARASLRVLRRELGNRDYRWANLRLRDAARPFAQVRDAKVLLERFNAISPAIAGHPDIIREVKRYLAVERHDARRRTLRKSTPRVARQAIRSVHERVLRSSKRSAGWSVAASGLRRVYRRAREALREATAHPSVETLHEWRKQTKYLRHGLEALLPRGSGGAPRRRGSRSSRARGKDARGRETRGRKGGALASRAHHLTDLLGEHHDLAVLGTKLVTGKMTERLQEVAVRLLEPRIVARRDHLQRQALALGRRFFARTPEQFERTVHEQWRCWRRGKSGSRGRHSPRRPR